MYLHLEVNVLLYIRLDCEWAALTPQHEWHPVPTCRPGGWGSVSGPGDSSQPRDACSLWGPPAQQAQAIPDHVTTIWLGHLAGDRRTSAGTGHGTSSEFVFFLHFFKFLICHQKKPHLSHLKPQYPQYIYWGYIAFLQEFLCQ